jgi:hypothetical protein
VLSGKVMTVSGSVRIAVEGTTIASLSVAVAGDDYDPNT